MIWESCLDYAAVKDVLFVERSLKLERLGYSESIRRVKETAMTRDD
jgi:hypothetical protein